jgi:hypothetical protein
VNPQPLGAGDWEQISRALHLLVVFVGLAVNAATALLLGQAVLPSLVGTADVPADLLRLRRPLLLIGLASAVLLVLALARGLALAVDVIQRVYPRFAI